jgi:integrase
MLNYRKSNTFNTHAGYFNKWQAWCDRHGKTALPADPWDVAEYLHVETIRCDESNLSASPISHIISALSCASRLAGMDNPADHIVVKMAKEAAVRLLGFRNRKMHPLYEQHIKRLYKQFAAPEVPHTPEDLQFFFMVALAYDACLRWDDLVDIRFGDMIWTKEYVKIFLVSCKTDKQKDGQWCTIMVSDKPYSAFRILLRILAYLMSFAGHFATTFGVSLEEAPVSFTFTHLPGGHMFPNLLKQWSYDQFMRRLKKSCRNVGLDPSLFGTHSMRRGANSDNVAHGVPDTICMQNGRWKTFSAYAGYIGDDVQLALRASFLRPLRS